MRNFHEQQTSQLKTIINRANERVSVFQIQKVVSSVQFSNEKENFSIVCAIVLKASIIHSKLRILHHQNTSS